MYMFLIIMYVFCFYSNKKFHHRFIYQLYNTQILNMQLPGQKAHLFLNFNVYFLSCVIYQFLFQVKRRHEMDADEVVALLVNKKPKETVNPTEIVDMNEVVTATQPMEDLVDIVKSVKPQKKKKTQQGVGQKIIKLFFPF